jgi:M6 family metalloprotease-like protein
MPGGSTQFWKEVGVPVPFNGEEFTFFNPDGSEVRVRGWGNQFTAVFETLDGYSVVKDPGSGFLVYATLSEDGTTLVPSGSRVGTVNPATLNLSPHLRTRAGAAKARAEAAQEATGIRPRWKERREERKREKASAAHTVAVAEAAPALAPKVGSYVGLCLLIQFPDVPATISQQEVSNFCNQPGYANFGNNGSVYDYYLAVSQGKLQYTNVVRPYYMARNPRSYYTDPSISFGTRARELIVEALDNLQTQGFNFTQLSADLGGFVYALNVFYAGPVVNNWSEGLWPHSWALASPYVVPGNRRFSDYQITNMGTQLTLRTFCHENGHMVCDFPDLYDYGGESNGIGNYCLMCYGGSNTNPVHVSAYLKNQAGWTTKLTTMASGMAYPVAAGANEFLIHSKSATEYFIIENRQKSGRDAALPDAGIAIWHVDENGNNSNEQMTAAQHYECSLEQADNRFDMEKNVNSGDAEDLFGAPAKTTFGASTAPSSAWWDGGQSGLEITNVTAPAGVVTVSTQAVWQNNLSVVRTHAKNGAQNAWAIVGNSPWLSVRPLSSDGVTKIFLILCEALANGRKVDVLIQEGQITEATLT